MGRQARLLAGSGLLTLCAGIGVLWMSGRRGVGPEEAALAPAVAAESGWSASGPPSPSGTRESTGEAPSVTSTRELAESPWTFRGRVLRERRDPLESFGVVATRLGTVGDVLERRELPLDQHPDGAFELSGLTPGHWVIAPFAPGRELVLERNFWEPDASEWTYLLLLAGSDPHKEPSASVSGIVLLPSGEPAVNAVVVAQHTLRDQLSPWNAGNVQARSAKGLFSLRLESGDWLLAASAKGWNTSSPVRVSSVAGLRLEGLELWLEPPRPVRFLVAAAVPARPRPVELSWAAVAGAAGADSGTASGLEGVELEVPVSGADTIEWTVTCLPGERWVGRLSLESGDRAPLVRLERLPASPVRLIVPDADLLGDWEAVAGDPAMGLLPAVRGKLDTTTGRLEFELPRPGRWHLRRGAASSGFVLDVPDVPVHEIPGLLQAHSGY